MPKETIFSETLQKKIWFQMLQYSKQAKQIYYELYQMQTEFNELHQQLVTITERARIENLKSPLVDTEITRLKRLKLSLKRKIYIKIYIFTHYRLAWMERVQNKATPREKVA